MDFVGADPESKDLECPAVFVGPDTGDFYLQGKLVTDPLVLAALAAHIPLGPDETVIWQPARMAPALAEAATGTYETGRVGHGKTALVDLIKAAKYSVVHLEQRDEYTPEPDFLEWRDNGKTASPQAMRASMRGWMEFVAEIVGRGVRMRRARIVSEPLSDYIQWERALTDYNVEAGEDVRWLSRRDGYDLLTPTADFYIIDSRLVAFNFNGGDGSSLREYEYVSDPARVGPVVAAFEQVWNRAVPHADYEPAR